MPENLFQSYSIVGLLTILTEASRAIRNPQAKTLAPTRKSVTRKMDIIGKLNTSGIFFLSGSQFCCRSF